VTLVECSETAATIFDVVRWFAEGVTVPLAGWRYVR
jgi:hypothetical protein